MLTVRVSIDVTYVARLKAKDLLTLPLLRCSILNPMMNHVAHVILAPFFNVKNKIPGTMIVDYQEAA